MAAHESPKSLSVIKHLTWRATCLVNTLNEGARILLDTLQQTAVGREEHHGPTARCRNWTTTRHEELVIEYSRFVVVVPEGGRVGFADYVYKFKKEFHNFCNEYKGVNKLDSDQKRLEFLVN